LIEAFDEVLDLLQHLHSNCDLHQVWAYDLHREFQRFFDDYEVHLASFYPDISAQEWQKR